MAPEGEARRLFFRAGEKVNDNDEQHGADGRGGERVEPAAVARADFKFAENPPAKDGTNQAEKNVSETAVAAASRDFSRQPTGDEAEQNPADETAINDDAKDLIHVKQEKGSGEHGGSLFVLVWAVVESVSETAGGSDELI